MWYEDGALVLGEFASYMVLFLLYLFFNLAWVFLGNDKMMEKGYEWGWARVTGVVLSLLLGIIGLIYVARSKDCAFRAHGTAKNKLSFRINRSLGERFPFFQKGVQGVERKSPVAIAMS